MTNPAVAIEIEEPDKEKYTGWFLKRYPNTWILPGGGHEIKFLDYWGVEYTGLQVSKDPGVWLIYLACIIMTIGLYACFFMSHKKVWINIASESTGKKGFTKVSIGGTASKNRLGFEKEVDHMLSKIPHAVEGKSQEKKQG
jgi:cytochrome c biogenesis protein